MDSGRWYNVQMEQNEVDGKVEENQWISIEHFTFCTLLFT